MERLAKEGRFDYVLIESTGVGEPVPVAQTFTYIDEEQGIDLSKYCRLDCMVTVVDANRFWHHLPETEEYGISSFVYELKRPFHPQRLMAWMEDWPAEIVRAKGTVWLASRSDMAQSFSQAGPSIQFGPAGTWVAALPEEEQRQTLQEDPEIAADWDVQYGDRVNKIVFIGIDMDRPQLADSLDACLLTEEELKLGASAFEDRFPKMPSAELEPVG